MEIAKGTTVWQVCTSVTFYVSWGTIWHEYWMIEMHWNVHRTSQSNMNRLPYLAIKIEIKSHSISGESAQLKVRHFRKAWIQTAFAMAVKVSSKWRDLEHSMTCHRFHLALLRAILGIPAHKLQVHVQRPCSNRFATQDKSRHNTNWLEDIL